MSYDALTESVRLLTGGQSSERARLSRRVRYVPLACDQDGDAAATLFLRRGVSGVPELDVHTLEWVDGAWRMLGGGSGPAYEAREPRSRLADGGDLAVGLGHGGTARTWRRQSGRPGEHWVSWAEFRLAGEVAALHVRRWGGVDARELRVAGHGYAIVVWTAEQLPEVGALDASGEVLGSVPVVRPRR